MDKEKFMKLLEKAKKDEHGNLYVERIDVEPDYISTNNDYNKIRYYFSLSTTICSDMIEKYCAEEKEGFELYDRHFINDDTLAIKIVKE